MQSCSRWVSFEFRYGTCGTPFSCCWITHGTLVNRVHSNLWTLRHFNGENVQKKLQNGLATWLFDSRQSAAGLSDFFCTHMCYSVVVSPYLLRTNTLKIPMGGGHTTGPLSRPWPPLHRPKRSKIGWCVEPLWVDRPLPHEAAKNYHGDGDLYIIIHLSCWFDLLV